MSAGNRGMGTWREIPQIVKQHELVLLAESPHRPPAGSSQPSMCLDNGFNSAPEDNGASLFQGPLLTAHVATEAHQPFSNLHGPGVESPFEDISTKRPFPHAALAVGDWIGRRGVYTHRSIHARCACDV